MSHEIKIEKKASEVMQPQSSDEARQSIQGRKDLSGADLQNMELKNLNAVGAVLRKTKLMGSNLSKSLLISPNFYRANLNGAAMHNTIVFGGDFVKTNFEDTDLSESLLVGTDARNACFNKANLRNAVILETDLREADFTSANLKDARLAAINVAGADFSGADTTGARSYRVDWSKAAVAPPSLPEPLIEIPRWVVSVLIGAVVGLVSVLIYYLVRSHKNSQTKST